MALIVSSRDPDRMYVSLLNWPLLRANMDKLEANEPCWLKKPQREGGRPVGCTCVQSAAKELNLGQPRTNPVSGRMEGQESRARNHQTQDQRPNYTASLGFNGDILSGNWILATRELNS